MSLSVGDLQLICTETSKRFRYTERRKNGHVRTVTGDNQIPASDILAPSRMVLRQAILKHAAERQNGVEHASTLRVIRDPQRAEALNHRIGAPIEYVEIDNPVQTQSQCIHWKVRIK